MSLVSLFRRRWQRLAVVSIVFCAVTLSILSTQEESTHDGEPSELQMKFPLLWEHVHIVNGTGGAWYIPPEWLPESQPMPETIVDAAQLAFKLANSTTHRSISHTEIPLIVHQTWKNTDIDTWPEMICDSVEKWLDFVVDTPMAYFLWDDDGVFQFLETFDPDFIEQFSSLAANVERSDVFRIMVLNYIGGIYGDVDTHPLRSPATWIVPSDLMPWYDPETGAAYSSTGPVRAVFGLEADCPPDSDSYWRMGYTHPVQLTQWALAAAPGHPALLRFMDNLSHRLQEVASHHGGNLTSASAFRELQRLDPLELTGPAALTVSVKSWLEESAGLRWNALTGLHDGGKSKLVDDVMILPITGFSPGRGVYGNMGSKPTTDPDARLLHHAQGSWKSFNLRVEFGKFCRTFFGLCKDWSKV